MAKQFGSLFHRLIYRRQVRALQRAADDALTMPLSQLRSIHSEARSLRRPLNRLAHVAEHRLALPVIGSTAVRTPIGTDWSWRPEIWRGPVNPGGHAAVESKTKIGSEATVFHDCKISELTFRQLRNTREADLAPFGLRLDVFRFDGSFLSLVLDLPQQSVVDLRRRHVIRMDSIVEMEKPLEIFARLNVQHGPNTEQIVRELPLHEDEISVEFDLAYTQLNEKRVERMWLDLIFEGPEMNQIILRDLTLSRRPRAEL